MRSPNLKARGGTSPPLAGRVRKNPHPSFSGTPSALSPLRMMTRGGGAAPSSEPDPASPGMRGAAIAPPDTRYPSAFAAPPFERRLRALFSARTSTSLMPWACAAFTVRGLPALKVRVAMGTALPGFYSGDPRRRVGRSLCRRHLRARSLPTTCGARDQSDPLRCHLRSIGLLAGRPSR